VGIGIPLGLSQAMVYDQVYSFSDPTVRESLYGGISYGEARDLAHFMKVEGRNHNLGTTLLLLDFEHKRSLEYTLAKDHLVLSSFGEEQNALPRFLITKNETREKALKNSGCCLEVLAEDSIGRYTILLLQPKS
jgi:hypothetical protein